MSTPAPPRNAAQLTQIQAHYEKQIEQVIAGLNLRRWLVERMIEKMPILDGFSVVEFVDTAERLHAFIVAPAKELTPPTQE